MNETGREPLPVIGIGSFETPFEDEVIVRLGEVLPGHVVSQRWYRAKARSIQQLVIEDVLPLATRQTYLLVLKISYVEGEPDRYILPVAVAGAKEMGGTEAVVRLTAANGDEGMLYSALGEAQFRDELLHAVACEKTAEGRNGVLRASRTKAFRQDCSGNAPHFESFVSRAEQSNTSIIYRERYILKLFRKLEAGINPDLEIGQFLTERGFRNTPTVLGSLAYDLKTTGESYGAGILQQFVANKGDAWAYTLQCLQGFFQRALASKSIPPTGANRQPIDEIGQAVPTDIISLIGPYLESAALLGKRTAEMHSALADPNGGPDFVPEDFSAADGRALYADLVKQAVSTFELLRRRAGTLSGRLAERVGELIALEPTVMERLKAFDNQPGSAKRIRHHGDYHLGQVLFTGEDFMIIDFEGEPARPLFERRAKALALRDVAGMLRSFEYAAFAVLFGQVPGVALRSETLPVVEKWAAAWYKTAAAAYLNAYFEEAGFAAFVPKDRTERRLFLDAFLLQKALYEVAYELNNRPEWLQIPVGGILHLLGSSSTIHG
ncbi:MAG TPA: putative maltokinase [Bryobacteraceae bacterium]|jgi:maltose alpha-D-glucosyltransferase/alpha-amylase|nr:putative maltokinase [Bryobacteraceae bacterium]